MKKILEELKAISESKIWEEDVKDEDATREELESTMGYGPDFVQPSAKEEEKDEPIKRKSSEEIDKDTLDLSDQLLKTKDSQRDYEEKVAKLIRDVVDKEAPINTLIKFIVKEKKKFKKKK